MLFKDHQLRHNDKAIRSWADGLVRLIRTTVEVIRVTNSTSEPMQDGHLVKLVKGIRQCRLATEDDGFFTGVLCQDCEPGKTALCRTSNYACVKFAEGQKPIEGELAYMGPEPGVAYVDGERPIGEIADASRFTPDRPFAKVILMRQVPVK